MADLKISALTAASTPLAGTEVLPIVQSSATVKVAVSDLTAGRTFSALGMTLTSTDAGATAAPLIDLYRDSATPAASDTLGEIEFNGEDSAGNKQTYGVIHGSILSPTSTAEQGQLHFETATAGALTEKMIIGTTNLVINEIGAVFNVRIEGDTDANLFYTDATNDKVGLGTASPAEKLDVVGKIKLSDNLVIGTSGKGVTSGNFSLGLGANGNTSAILIDTTNRALINTTTVGGGAGGSTILTAVSLSGQDAVFIKGAGSSAGNLPLGVWNDAGSGDNALLYFYTNNTISFKGGIDYNRAANLVRYNTSSDGTLKNIIGDSNGERSIEILKTTRLRDYTWKDDPDQNVVIGPIAQELYETYKGAVSVGGDVERQRDITEEVQEEYVDENGDTQTRTITKVVATEKYIDYRPWAVDKTAFSFHLVAGWQAHEKTIAAQQTLIEQLTARIAALEAK